MVVWGRIHRGDAGKDVPHEASGAEDGSALGVIVDPPDHPVQAGAGTARQVASTRRRREAVESSLWRQEQ
jgi:hypothetical protein